MLNCIKQLLKKKKEGRNKSGNSHLNKSINVAKTVTPWVRKLFCFLSIRVSHAGVRVQDRHNSWRVGEPGTDLPPVGGESVEGPVLTLGRALCLSCSLAGSCVVGRVRELQVLELLSCVQSGKSFHTKQTNKKSKNHCSHWTGRADICVLSPRGGALCPHCLWNRLLLSATAPKSSGYQGERPEVLWGHNCPIEMSWAHGFRNVFCQVSKVRDNKIKVDSSFLKRLPLIFIPGEGEP